jgi:hypothetical protein
MTAVRIVLVLVLVLLVAACGGGAAKPTTPPAGPASRADDASGCRPAYAEYERRWRIARSHELAGFPDAFAPDEIEDIVSEETGVLPDRDELRTLRWMYAIVELFAPDAEWVVAFTAAERAIAACGENAVRPT